MNKFKMVIGALLLLVAIHCACTMENPENTTILTLAFYAIVSAVGGGLVLCSVDEDKKGKKQRAKLEFTGVFENTSSAIEGAGISRIELTLKDTRKFNPLDLMSSIFILLYSRDSNKVDTKDITGDGLINYTMAKSTFKMMQKLEDENPDSITSTKIVALPSHPNGPSFRVFKLVDGVYEQVLFTDPNDNLH